MVERSDLYKGGPVKELTEGLNKTGGRNNQGRITSRRMGGGHKRRYRFIDFRRNKFDVAATVERLEYDPNRTAFIALIKYEDGERSYIWRRSVCKSVIRLFPVKKSISNRATQCR